MQQKSIILCSNKKRIVMAKNKFTNDAIISFIKNSLYGLQTIGMKDVKGKMVRKPFNETIEAHVRKLKKNKTFKSKFEELQKIQKDQNIFIKERKYEEAAKLRTEEEKILMELRELLPKEKTGLFIKY